MLEVSQLARKYGNFKAVDDVSFTINKGEIVGLLGHNGAGKTTIMKMISGFIEPNRGKILVDDVDLSENPQHIQRTLGYLPENIPLYPEMTVVDYLDYSADLKGLVGDSKSSEINRAIHATDIASKLLAPISTLSRGFKQRVGVAQAILGRPKLLILDEPTNGLDPEQTQHMRDLICDLAKDATVILSTHIMQEVEAICSRVLMLRTGRLEVDAKLEELTQSNSLVLETSLAEDDLEDIGRLDGVKSVEVFNHSFSNSQIQAGQAASQNYRISLDASANHKQISSQIARKVIQQNGELYRLLPEIRDLETLFSQVSELGGVAEGVNHAA